MKRKCYFSLIVNGVSKMSNNQQRQQSRQAAANTTSQRSKQHRQRDAAKNPRQSQAHSATHSQSSRK